MKSMQVNFKHNILKSLKNGAYCLPNNEQIKEVENDWKCIKVEGILDFSLTGVLSSLANPLAENKISIFAISTYNTDYLLIKSHSIEQARVVLENEGHSFSDMYFVPRPVIT